MIYKISVNDQKFEVAINTIKDGIAQVNVNGQPYDVLIENYKEVAAGSYSPSPEPSYAAAPAAATAPKPVPTTPSVSTAAPPKPAMTAASPAPKKVQAAGEIVAPIPGRIMDIKVKVGDAVSKGQTVATMEAMKMENNIASTTDGFVQEIRVQKDSEVATGEVIMIIE
jgi:biotin carboxyl carrier protein